MIKYQVVADNYLITSLETEQLPNSGDLIIIRDKRDTTKWISFRVNGCQYVADAGTITYKVFVSLD